MSLHQTGCLSYAALGMNFLLVLEVWLHTHTFILCLLLDPLSRLVRVAQADYCATERGQGEQLNLTAPHNFALLIELSLWGSAPLSYETGVLINNST